jgi:hypothetical protein
MLWFTYRSHDDPNVARVLVKKVRVERTRRLRDCYLGLELWKRLGLDEFLAQHLDRDGPDVAWSRVAAVLAINRLCAPGHRPRRGTCTGTYLRACNLPRRPLP